MKFVELLMNKKDKKDLILKGKEGMSILKLTDDKVTSPTLYDLHPEPIDVAATDTAFVVTFKNLTAKEILTNLVI